MLEAVLIPTQAPILNLFGNHAQKIYSKGQYYKICRRQIKCLTPTAVRQAAVL
jgi:hypothetical protein